ncbi:MAG: acetyl-CoA carboxylase, biotin carboxyl carrier protein, partial [Ruminococcus sp.]|nr:acetyl-CoA carboxylase, biotin carboxyl carrier protein [Ruminococcus sp.]
MSDIFGMAELETIERLADIINEKELSEVTITDGGKSITIKGKKCPPPPPMHMGMPPMQAMGAPVPMQQPASAPQQSAAEPKLSGKVVKSPIVGTYYAAPSPEKPA